MRKITTLLVAIIIATGLNAQKLTLTVNVEMKPALDEAVYGFTQTSGTVWITGSFAGWAKPGDAGSVQLTQSQAQVSSTVWIGELEVDANTEVQFKVFVLDNAKTPSWDLGEWTGDPNRKLAIGANNMVTNITWGDVTTVDAPEVSTLEVVTMFPNPVSDELTVSNLQNVNRIVISNVLGQVVRVITNVTEVTYVDMSQLEKGIYLVSIVDNNNNMKTERIVKQ